MFQDCAGGLAYSVFPGSAGMAAGCILYAQAARQPDGVALPQDLSCDLVVLQIENWNDDMTPWPAPALYRNVSAFGGQANRTLASINEIIASLKRHGLHASRLGIAGYSLGGLFALYSFLKDDRFHAAASMSGSLWYKGWIEYLHKLAQNHRDLTGTSAYLSVGSKERHAREKALQTVEKNTEETADFLESWGVKTKHELNRGGHFDHVDDRVAAGLHALDAWLS